MERRNVRKEQSDHQKTASLEMENGDIQPFITKTNLKGDGMNIALLFFLYTLQGIPLGLSAAIPMILQNRGVSYKQQVCSYYSSLE